jgi:hypothetical protein
MMNLISTSHLVLILSLLIHWRRGPECRKRLPCGTPAVAAAERREQRSHHGLDHRHRGRVAPDPGENPALPYDPVASRRAGISSFPTSESYPRRRMTRRDKKRGGMAPAAPHFSKLAGPGLRAPRCQTSS